MESYFALPFVVLALALSACQGDSQTASVSTETSALGATDDESSLIATMWVNGMGCPQCAFNVDRQLLKVKGVRTVKVDMSDGKVIAELSPHSPPTRAQLVEAIRETGFTLVKIEMPE